jgi:hypothetical protein
MEICASNAKKPIKKGLSNLDAEGVIGLSSPYKGTAERSSATKKPHKKGRNPPIFVGGFQHYIGLLKIQ